MAHDEPRLPVSFLRYQVVVIHHEHNYFAHLFDLKCEAIGRTADEAIAAVNDRAAAILRGYEGQTIGPPTPSRVTITSIQIPMPATRKSPEDMP